MTRNKKLGIGIGGIVLLGVGAWLAFGIFGIQTLFIDDVVDEANPFATEVVATSDDDAAGDANIADDPDESISGDPSDEVDAVDEGDVAAADVDEPAELPSTEPDVPEIQTLASGSLVDHAHGGDGTITVITDGDRRFLRFEDDFAVDNGPDLNVYLVRGADAGRLRSLRR